MKRYVSVCLVFFLLLTACTKGDQGTDFPIQPENQVQETIPEKPSDVIPTEQPVPKESDPKKKCGDGICDGPENENNCPEDCTVEGQDVPDVQDDSGSICDNPNPYRAVVSEELLVWHDWLVNGDFESESEVVSFTEHPDPSLRRANDVQRIAEAAHSGDFGYAITTEENEGLTFSVKIFTEKGDDIRFSFWVRSIYGKASIKPVVYGTSRATAYEYVEFYNSDNEYLVGEDWVEISFEVLNKTYESVMLSIPVESNLTLHLDDFKIEQHIFKMAEYSGESRIIGGIPVPPTPEGPLHFTVLIHIEDPDRLHEEEEYYWQQAERMRELARILHEHGGFLTIQPEEDWPMATDLWSPGLLAELAENYNVVYSTHTHGPHCADDEGRLRSYSDCNKNQETAGWDHQPSNVQNPWVTQYVAHHKELLEAASGTEVTDHNGNWEFVEINTYAEIPMLTLSAYKSHYTQQTYDMLINNPWRPTGTNADRDINTFLTHDPTTKIIYIPGWGQNVARYLDRILTRTAPLLSQFLFHVDPERVNTFYLVTHVGSFEPKDGIDSESYISLDKETGELIYSGDFQQDLSYWDEMLTSLIDPLVDAGYIQWTNLPEMGELYLEWEENCTSGND